jgi:hypothetical protein
MGQRYAKESAGTGTLEPENLAPNSQSTKIPATYTLSDGTHAVPFDHSAITSAIRTQQVHTEQIAALEAQVLALTKRVTALAPQETARPSEKKIQADTFADQRAGDRAGPDNIRPDTVKEIQAMLARRGNLAPLRERLERETLDNLRAMCKLAGLPSSGVKADVIERLSIKEVDPMLNDLMEGYKKADLQAACSTAGLSTSGNKYNLAQRLLRAAPSNK